MKFVALLSGGKDSCYSTLKAQIYGHELVCLANLHPDDVNTEELNSFMFQTAGHSILNLLATCFNVPLIRGSIKGHSKIQSLDYSHPEVGDEVEDLYNLLLQVKTIYPDIQGVSCGAIASTYQRLRVENVCKRLNLQSISYLWQRHTIDLFHEMILQAHMKVILVKVAGAGLNPHKHLGKSLDSLALQMQQLNNKYGLDVCGEGGEYETITLDVPCFTHEIEILQSNIVVDTEHYDVGNLHIIDAQLREKNDEVSDIHTIPGLSNTFAMKFIRECISILHTYETKYKYMMSQKSSLYEDIAHVLYPNDIITSLSNTSIISSNNSSSSNNNSSSTILPDIESNNNVYLDELYYTPIVTPTIHNNIEDSISDHLDILTEVANQMHDIMIKTNHFLQHLSLSMDDILYTHLYIRHISYFDTVNNEYCTWFQSKSPSRSCIAIDLPDGVYCQADFIIFRNTDKTHNNPYIRDTQRKILHVKSLSEWAPVCIGPYSQANMYKESLVYVSGQIPLDPAVMTIWTLSLKEELDIKCPKLMSKYSFTEWSLLCIQTILCLRHVSNVLETMNSSLQKTLSCIIYINTGDTSPLSQIAHIEYIKDIQTLCQYLIHYGYSYGILHVKSEFSTTTAADDYEYSDDIEEVDDDSDDMKLQASHTLQSCAITCIEVNGLPRDALIEVEVIAHTNLLSENMFHSYTMQSSYSHNTISKDNINNVATSSSSSSLTQLPYTSLSLPSTTMSQPALSITDIEKERQYIHDIAIQKMKLFSLPLFGYLPVNNFHALEEELTSEYSSESRPISPLTYPSIEDSLMVAKPSLGDYNIIAICSGKYFKRTILVCSIQYQLKNTEEKTVTTDWLQHIENIQQYINEAVQVVYLNIMKYLSISELSPIYIKTIRIFYNKNNIPINLIKNNIESMMKQYNLGILCPISIQYIAVNNSDKLSLFHLNMMVIDCNHIKTADWIYNGK